VFATIIDSIQAYRARRWTKVSRYRKALNELPDSLFPYWQRNAGFEFKGIRQDAFFFVRAAEGLLTFFDCVRHSGRPCALPSKAADSVWHAWNRLAPMGLEQFCQRHFGQVIPHVEANDMGGQMGAALATCLVQARKLESLPEAGPKLPRLFVLDRQLKMPGGFGYTVADGRVAFADLDHRGSMTEQLIFPASVGPAELLMAGLITELAYNSYSDRLKRHSSSAGGGSSCGSSCGSTMSSDSGSSGDSGGCDGGAGEGGSSCGSSCGSGCGGH
jgi:hypothetical protein